MTRGVLGFGRLSCSCSSGETRLGLLKGSLLFRSFRSQALLWDDWGSVAWCFRTLPSLHELKPAGVGKLAVL